MFYGFRVMQRPAVVDRRTTRTGCSRRPNGLHSQPVFAKRSGPEASAPVHHELTVWSRGIIMDKEARDVSTCIASAARRLGYYAENVSDYVDDPDRTN